ncbi:accessory gene regulator ArgB-like protein [Cohnella nanjingensis]|uniref:Accessory gene regulator B family protein n=1 Tax=Cohnella nanjingensis TaxID=1387779 RepID=A0A7X0RX88_9BACL|nr:accessory gene regulator B family protein [Cohnella nanjingensis]MBB6675327.1 accessory gene regulator B family protein [Cohnella nanjingensis]
MIDAVSWRIARGIKSAVPEHPLSVEVLKYAVSFVLNTGSIIVFSLAISFFTGRVAEVLTVLVAYALLRQVSGGLHLKSGTLCVVASTAGITAMSFADFGPAAVTVANLAALLLAAVYAPSRIEGQTRIPKKYYPLLRFVSIIIVSSNFLIQSPILAAAFLVQCVTLIRPLRRGGEHREEKGHV